MNEPGPNVPEGAVVVEGPRTIGFATGFECGGFPGPGGTPCVRLTMLMGSEFAVVCMFPADAAQAIIDGISKAALSASSGFEVAGPAAMDAAAAEQEKLDRLRRGEL